MLGWIWFDILKWWWPGQGLRTIPMPQTRQPVWSGICREVLWVDIHELLSPKSGSTLCFLLLMIFDQLPSFSGPMQKSPWTVARKLAAGCWAGCGSCQKSAELIIGIGSLWGLVCIKFFFGFVSIAEFFQYFLQLQTWLNPIADLHSHGVCVTFRQMRWLKRQPTKLRPRRSSFEHPFIPEGLMCFHLFLRVQHCVLVVELWLTTQKWWCLWGKSEETSSTGCVFEVIPKSHGFWF